jgi:hypothetical protein
MAGVGYGTGTSGAARETATLKALTSVTQTILSEIKSSLVIETKQRRENDDVTWTEELNQVISNHSEATLPGHDVVDSWVDTQNGETVVLVVVSRELLCSTLFPGVEQAITEAGEYLDTPANLSTTQPGQALSRALQAYAVLSERMLDATKSRVVASSSPLAQQANRNFDQATDLLDEASSRLARLAGSIRIDKVSGDGQLGAVRGALAEALTARLSIVDENGRTHALARFPARFVVTQDPGPSLAHSSTSTDDSGLISCRVSDLVATGIASSEIVIEPDFGRLAPGLGSARIPYERFTYLLPTAGQTSVLVLISDDFEGAPIGRQITGDDLGDHLSGHGFDVLVIDPTSREGLVLATVDDTALAQKVGELYPDRFECIIHGRTTTRFSSKSSGIFFYYSLAALQIDSLRSGSSFAIATNEVKGGHPTQGGPGINKALTTLHRLLHTEVDEQFVSEFVIETDT